MLNDVTPAKYVEMQAEQMRSSQALDQLITEHYTLSYAS